MLRRSFALNYFSTILSGGKMHLYLSPTFTHQYQRGTFSVDVYSRSMCTGGIL